MRLTRLGNNRFLPGIGDFLPGNARTPLRNANSALGNAVSHCGIGNSEAGNRNSEPGKSISDPGKGISRLEEGVVSVLIIWSSGTKRMRVEFDIRPSVQKNTKLPFERLRVVQRLADLQIPEIRRAVIFVFAVWSGPAVLALVRFTRLLSTLDLGSLPIIVLDNDCMTADDMIRLFGHVFHGGGETLWVRDGRVVAELSAYQPEAEALIIAHTKELL